MPDPEVLLDIHQLARRLSCGRSAAYALVASGVLPVVRVGRAVRVPNTAVDAFIRDGGVRVIPKASPGGDGKASKRIRGDGE